LAFDALFHDNSLLQNLLQLNYNEFIALASKYFYSYKDAVTIWQTAINTVI